MRRLLIALALVAAGCTSTQDLGVTAGPSDSGPSEPAAPAPPAPSAVPLVAPERAPEVGPCPRSAPVDGAGCGVDVGWCSYRVDPAGGLAAKCACSIDRRWTCLLVRDNDRRNPLPADAVPLTSASCTEGAPCAEGVRCSVSGSSPRTCGCTSAGILLCTRPAQ